MVVNSFDTEILMLLDGSYGVWVQILSWFHLLVFQPAIIIVFGIAMIKAGVMTWIKRAFMFTVRVISLPLVAVFWIVWNIVSNLEHINSNKKQ